jgi:low temperature requirement protein LtrA
MTQSNAASHNQVTINAWMRPMRGRDPKEHHRVATTLELLFDLVFVIAIAFAGAQLHHAVVENHMGSGLIHYAMTFFAIWWAWMGFTWFGSAFDTDDVVYRIAVFVQMAGALVIAAGVDEGFAGDFRLITYGYTIMRLASVAQWLRAAKQSPTHRSTALRFAAGIFLVQVGWLAILHLPKEWGYIAFSALVLAEFAVPLWAERAGMTNWHPHHISERYGLMTIIVLGESILAVAQALNKSTVTAELPLSMVLFGIGSLMVIFAMWWLYFDHDVAHHLTRFKTVFVWGYGHYLIFAAAAATGAGMAAYVDVAHLAGQTMVPLAVKLFVSGPVATFVMMLWLIHRRVGQNRSQWPLPVTSFCLLATAWLPFHNLLVMGVLLVLCVAIQASQRPRDH